MLSVELLLLYCHNKVHKSNIFASYPNNNYIIQDVPRGFAIGLFRHRTELIQNRFIAVCKQRNNSILSFESF